MHDSHRHTLLHALIESDTLPLCRSPPFLATTTCYAIIHKRNKIKSNVHPPAPLLEPRGVKQIGAQGPHLAQVRLPLVQRAPPSRLPLGLG